ncbi:MAG: hypothetical protein WBQ41_01440 [Solirubrobacterales bacterium]
MSVTDIAEHDARAGEIQTDLDRWISDHGRKVEVRLNGIRNELASRGHLYSGIMRTQLEAALEEAQEQFRNEASAAIRQFRELAREEGPEHDRVRNGEGPVLLLSDEQHEAITSWRQRPYPIPDTGEGLLRPRDLIGEDREIAPLLRPEGLSWTAARSGE